MWLVHLKTTPLKLPLMYLKAYFTVVFVEILQLNIGKKNFETHCTWGPNANPAATSEGWKNYSSSDARCLRYDGARCLQIRIENAYSCPLVSV